MDKLEQLRSILKEYQQVAIAYSGGCDSNFLFQVAVDTLGKENVLAILCVGDMMSMEDIKSARSMLQGYRYHEIAVDVLALDAFLHNDKKRCYYCKKRIMSLVKKVAKEQNIAYVLDGKNVDDENVYRPGIQACKELKIHSPLAKSRMTKKEIREYSKQLNIVTYNKPANACLASRFDYNTLLSKEKLMMVDQAEQIFHEIGILHVRVRVQEKLARIEVEPKYFPEIIKHPEILEKMKKLGFQYVTLDLEGIKSGSFDR